MNIRFAHINIVAKEWKKLADFYINVFSCKPKPPERYLSGEWLDKLTGLKSAKINGIHLSLPGYDKDSLTIEIFEYDKNKKNCGKLINMEGFAHIAFAVEDVEACLKLLMEKGGSTVGKVVKTKINGVGQIHVVYARDPEGNIIEIQKWD